MKRVCKNCKKFPERSDGCSYMGSECKQFEPKDDIGAIARKSVEKINIASRLLTINIQPLLDENSRLREENNLLLKEIDAINGAHHGTLSSLSAFVRSIETIVENGNGSIEMAVSECDDDDLPFE